MSSPINTVRILREDCGVFHESIERWDAGYHGTPSNPVLVERVPTGRGFVFIDELDFSAIDEDPHLVLSERKFLQLVDARTQKVRRYRAVQA